MGDLDELKGQLLQTAKRMYNEALVAGTSGNLSCYHYQSKLVVITPTSIDYGAMTVEDIAVIDLAGRIIEGAHQPSSEWPMHVRVYQQRPDVGAVVHTHSPYATAFAVTGDAIPLILIEMVPFLGGDVLVAEFALPGSVELGDRALKTLTKRNACLLSNHGVLAIGRSLDQAYLRAVYTEDAAKIYHYARTVGQARPIPAEAAAIMRRKYGATE